MKYQLLVAGMALAFLIGCSQPEEAEKTIAMKTQGAFNWDRLAADVESLEVINLRGDSTFLDAGTEELKSVFSWVAANRRNFPKKSEVDDMGAIEPPYVVVFHLLDCSQIRFPLYDFEEDSLKQFELLFLSDGPSMLD